jgi:hypothetical protein
MRYYFFGLMLSVLTTTLLAQVKPALPEEEDMEAQIEKVRKKVLTQGKVCPDPAKPCRTTPDFLRNELSFSIAKKFEFDRGEDRSQPFYGVILRSDKLCSIKEEERLKVQALFPGRKVFVHQLYCYEGSNDPANLAEKVTYTNVNRQVGFIAVYAGETEEEARKFLAEVKAGPFKDATLRRMQAVVIHQLE